MADGCHRVVKAAIAFPFFASEVEACHGATVCALENTEAAAFNLTICVFFCACYLC